MAACRHVDVLDPPPRERPVARFLVRSAALAGLAAILSLIWGLAYLWRVSW